MWKKWQIPTLRLVKNYSRGSWTGDWGSLCEIGQKITAIVVRGELYSCLCETGQKVTAAGVTVVRGELYSWSLGVCEYLYQL